MVVCIKVLLNHYGLNGFQSLSQKEDVSTGAVASRHVDAEEGIAANFAAFIHFTCPSAKAALAPSKCGVTRKYVDDPLAALAALPTLDGDIWGAAL